MTASLVGLTRQGLIEEWHDREIGPGREWEKDIDENLKAAEIILFLVSLDFMSSDYVYEKEMKRALERHERGEARVIPIIVRPTDWEWAPFRKLQALPKDAKPITTWANQDEAWLDVVRGIRKAVEALQGKPSEHERGATSTQQAQQPAELARQTNDGEEEDLLRRYREVVEMVWVDGEVDRREAELLRDLASSKLGLSSSTAADIEREVMGDTVEAILERQERAAREPVEGAAREPVSGAFPNPYDYTAYILERFGPGSQSGQRPGHTSG